MFIHTSSVLVISYSLYTNRVADGALAKCGKPGMHFHAQIILIPISCRCRREVAVGGCTNPLKNLYGFGPHVYHGIVEGSTS